MPLFPKIKNIFGTKMSLFATFIVISGTNTSLFATFIVISGTNTSFVPQGRRKTLGQPCSKRIFKIKENIQLIEERMLPPVLDGSEGCLINFISAESTPCRFYVVWACFIGPEKRQTKGRTIPALLFVAPNKDNNISNEEIEP